MSGIKVNEICGFLIGNGIIMGRVKHKQDDVVVISYPRVLAKNQQGVYGTIPLLDEKAEEMIIPNNVPILMISETAIRCYIKDTSDIAIVDKVPANLKKVN